MIILFVTHPIFFTFKNVFWNFSALMTVAFYVASLKKSVTLQINWEGLLASDEIVLTRESRIFLCWEESRPFLWWNFGPLGIKSSSSGKEARGRGAKGYFWPYQPPWRIWPFCGLCQGKRRSDIFTFHKSFKYAFSVGYLLSTSEARRQLLILDEFTPLPLFHKALVHRY